MYFETSSTDFNRIIAIFTTENGRPLEIEDKGNLANNLTWKIFIGYCY